jgi:uncharacterized iron-regulated membrane protein
VTEQVGLTETIKQIHSLSLFNAGMNLIVEVVAGWAIILVATGLYMWWPRGRGLATFRPRLSEPGRRPFWRDLHAVTGVYVGLIIAFLALTGMPWSAVWGDRFLNIVRESGLGRPAASAAASSFAHAKPHDAPVGVGWTMEDAVMHGHPATNPSLARVLAVAEREGLARPFVVNIPQSPDLAWTLAHETRRAEDARSLYVDGQTGAVKADIRWSQFGVGAKAFEWGIAVHQGMQYGQINRILMLIGCIGVWVLGISGLVMWWKRRPSGRLGAPIATPGLRARKAVLLIVLPLCVLFPLTGLSLIAAMAVDRLVSLLAARRAAA